jgi:AraC family transcriptional regulator, arabinose operon regulatory protein
VIPEKYLFTDLIQSHFLSDDREKSVLNCGFKHRREPHKVTLSNCSYYSAFYIIAGKGTYRGENGLYHELEAGDLVQRFPHVHHTTTIEIDESSKSNDLYQECFLSLSPQFSHYLEEIDVISRDKPVLKPGLSITMVKRFYSLLCDLKENNYRNNAFQALRQAHAIIFDMVHRDSQHTHSTEHELITSAKVLLANNLQSRQHTKEMLEKLPISYSRIRTLFKEHTRQTPGQFRIQERLDKACRLLVTSTMSVIEIADHLGYPDSFSFSKQFKKVKKVTPREFRDTF